LIKILYKKESPAENAGIFLFIKVESLAPQLFRTGF